VEVYVILGLGKVKDKKEAKMRKFNNKKLNENMTLGLPVVLTL